MNHIGLFEGIGGFSLAARWMGWNTIAWCEWNEFGQKVLKHHFPNAKPHGDITKTDFTIYRGQCDILTGGFPCQPYSSAGKRLGKEDERHLWPEMLRAIREIQPGYVVGENVRGLTNWNGGVVFDEVQADLEAEGYEVLPFLLPACAVNAPHRRDRIWFIAHNKNSLFWTGSKRRITGGQDGEYLRSGYWPNGKDGIATYANSDGQHRRNSKHEINTSERGQYALNDFEQMGVTSNANGIQRCKGRMHEAGCQQTERYACSCNAQHDERNTWQNFPTQSPICGRNDGLPTELDRITFSKWRNESIKAYGNAIVPQVAYQIFKAIQSVA